MSEFPTWDLFCAFLCTDGKPIDESPLYDPADPFKNRDPRLAESIVEFGTDFCGVVYDPRFDVEQVWDSNVGRNITNPDNIVTASESRLPSRTGLVQRKGIDKDWTDDYQADPDKIIMRYADVLLMYAEAKIELNEIDDATLEAMNRVRARAYGVQHTETDKYPAIVTRSQSELRTILRTERRMEFAFERLRIYDLLRWRIAEKVLNYSDWTIKYNAGANVLKKVMTDGQWFIPTPAIDESGCPEMDATFSRENRPHITALYNRVFNPEIHYLWPLPATDVLVNKNLKQNYGY
ncbi:MAG: RagB/SusD family nutrient uptake outer membrane protein [Alistipes senegalensis]|nr:RagB/SusD family nutrient uptake outer membrane protein [Alistipes senegalensis]